MPALEARHMVAREELKKIIDDKGSHPITYNHYYTTTIQKVRTNKQACAVEKLIMQHQTENSTLNGRPTQVVDGKGLAASLLASTIQGDMDRFSAED